MSDKFADWLRTVVPALWSALVAWAVVHQLLPASLAGWAGGLGAAVAVPVVLGAVYAGLRWFEARSWVPDWLTRILLGSARVPTFPPTGAAAEWIRRFEQAASAGAVVTVLPPSAVTTNLYPMGGTATVSYPPMTTVPSPSEPATPPSGPAGTSPPIK